MRSPNEPLYEYFKDLKKKTDEIFSSIEHDIAKNQETLNRIFQTTLASPLFENLQKHPDELAKVIPYLLERNWFLSDYGILEVKQIATWIDEQKHNDIKEKMMKVTTERINFIYNGLIDRWPDRAKILDSAFFAHEKRVYELSVPTFLAQADGIAYEMFGESLYGQTRQNTRPQTTQEVEQYLTIAEAGLTIPSSSKSLLRLFLQPLVEVNLPDKIVDPIRSLYNREDRPKTEDCSINPLNRHGVQHGFDLHYATEEKSLQMISRLGYLKDVGTIFPDGH